MRKLILGVDGGGTKTEAVLAEVDDSGQPRELGSAITGPGNVTHDQSVALTSIRSAITGAFQNARIESRQVDSLVLALAGAGQPIIRQQVLRLANQFAWSKNIWVVPDPLPVIAAGSRDMHGIALICGTGSAAWAQTDDGITSRAGGEGIEDPGSGYWIGLHAIHLVCHKKIDGEALRHLHNRIESIGIEWRDAQPPRGIEPANMSADWNTRRRGIASIAPDVFLLAEGDQEIARIVDEAVDELAQLVQRIDQDLSKYDRLPLFLAGGVFTNQPEFAARVGAAAGRDHAPVITRPVLGAVNLAIAAE